MRKDSTTQSSCRSDAGIESPVVANRERAYAFMRRHQIDAFLVASPVNVTYFTNWFFGPGPPLKEWMIKTGGSSGPAAPAYALFPLEGRPSLIVPCVFAANALDLDLDLITYGSCPGEPGNRPQSLSARVNGIANAMRFTNHSTAPEAIRALLQPQGLHRSRIGVDFMDAPSGLRASLEAELPTVSLRDATNVVRMIRAVKSPTELARLRRTADINEQGLLAGFSILAPGCPVRVGVEGFRATVGGLGADFEHLSFSISGLGVAREPEHILSAGEVMMIDSGCIWGHYFSDTGVTLACGHTTDQTLAAYGSVYSVIQAGAETLRPGTKASDVHSRMVMRAEETGAAQAFVSQLRSAAQGHGLGLEARDYPIIVAANGLRIVDDCMNASSDLYLEEDMVINLEASVFIPTSGALEVEQSFVVTPEGAVPLVEQERRSPIVAN